MNFEGVIRNVASEIRFKVPQAHPDDLMQEGRIAVWLKREAIDKLDPEHQMRFAGQCARWAMLDYVRKMWPQRGLAGNLMGGSTDEIEDFDVPGPDSTFSSVYCAELIERIATGIHATCKRSEGRRNKRAVLELLLEEHEGSEIAARLGVSAECVSLHKTALAAIAKDYT